MYHKFDYEIILSGLG